MHFIRTYLSGAKAWALAHKKTSIFALLVVLIGGYSLVHAMSATSAQTRYVLSAVGKGTVISSVSGTGQVATTNTVTLTSKASGELVSVNVIPGQSVKAGQLIAQVDATNAAYDLESARIAYDKLVTVDSTSLSDAQSGVTQAQEDIDKGYADARTTLTSTPTDMQDVLDGIDALFGKNGYLTGQNYDRGGAPADTYRDKAQKSFYAAQTSLKAFQAQERSITQGSSEATIESAVSSGYQTSLLVAQAAKDTKDAVVYIRNHDESGTPKAESAYTSATSLSASADVVVSDFNNVKTTLVDNVRALAKAQQSLEDVKDGPDTSDIRSQTLSIREKQQTLADYSVRAPFDGVIASVSAHKGDAAGGSTEIATLITKEKIAQISLNEIDATKVAVGQKATLTFDAIDSLTISGTVAEMDLVGTVTQGVVSYTVKIGLDTDDDRVKPGMTVSADIVTDIAQDVIEVPTSAIKSQGDASYVETIPGAATTTAQGIISTTAPEMIPVTIGLSGDDSTEILSGLSEGDVVITRTIAPTTSKTTATAPSLLGGGATRTTGATGAARTFGTGGTAGR
ncbi:MAG: efflux RND transporter periplasmic adaptor subunit [Patescibacteria group bacterium]